MSDFIASVVAATIVIFIRGLILYVLWNLFVPDEFGLQALTYYQSAVIIIISGIIVPVRIINRTK